MLARNGRVLLEGQLGVMRDLDWGAYPYVTSSSPIPAGLLTGGGVPPTSVDRVIGVVKAYTTAVGTGPLPTELTDARGDELRERGGEYGAATGRPRRCGWFDAAAVAWAGRVAGFTEIVLTKLDVLTGIPSLPIATGYRDGKREIEGLPTTAALATAEPVYTHLPGWATDIDAARTVDELPREARAYVDEVERLSGVPVAMVSVGPERAAMIPRGLVGGL